MSCLTDAVHFDNYSHLYFFILSLPFQVARGCFWMTQGLDNGDCSSTTSPGPRPLSVPDVDKLQLHEPRIDSYRFSMANLEGMLGSIGTTHNTFQWAIHWYSNDIWR